MLNTVESALTIPGRVQIMLKGVEIIDTFIEKNPNDKDLDVFVGNVNVMKEQLKTLQR
jgi:hypothetical protein